VRRRQHGEAVQVDPIKPTLKAPGTNRLKLNYDALLSNVAFKFNLRRYNMSAILTNFALGIEWVPERWRPSLVGLAAFPNFNFVPLVTETTCVIPCMTK
jgi:hypothetical protein